MPKPDRPSAASNERETATSHSIGYDTEQKSGYDTATHAAEARRTAEEVQGAADAKSSGRQQAGGREAKDRPAGAREKPGSSKPPPG